MRRSIRGAAVVLAACAACASYTMMPLPAAPGAMPVRSSAPASACSTPSRRTARWIGSSPERGPSSPPWRSRSAGCLPPPTEARAGPFRGCRRSTRCSSGRPASSCAPGRGYCAAATEGGAGTPSLREAKSWIRSPQAPAAASGPVAAGTSSSPPTAAPPSAPSAGPPREELAGARHRRHPRRTLCVSVHGDPLEPRDPRRRFAALLEYTSDEAVSALTLIDAREGGPRTLAGHAGRRPLRFPRRRRPRQDRPLARRLDRRARGRALRGGGGIRCCRPRG